MQFTSLKPWIFYAIVIRFFLDGAEEFFITPTAWYYIKSMGQSITFLGIVLSAYPVGALLTGPIIGKFSDRFGYVKCILVFSYVMKIFANLIYSVPVSPYFPLVGRIVSGLADGSSGVLFGQVIMYTPPQHRAKCLIIIDGMFAVGAFAGPMVSVFLTFNLNILGWRIDAGNSPGIILALIWSVMLIISLWYPKEFGYKISTDNDHDCNDELAGKDSIESSNYGSLSTICLLFYLIFTSIFYSTAVTFYVPLLAQEHFHLQFLHVKLLFITSSMFAMVLFISIYLAADYVSETHLLAGLKLLQIAAICIITYFAFNWENVYGVYEGYFLIAYICFGMPDFSFTLGCTLMSKVTEPKHAAFYQGSSFSALHLGYAAGRIISAFIFTKTSVIFYCMGLILSWVLGAVWLAVEYRNLKGPRIKS